MKKTPQAYGCNCIAMANAALEQQGSNTRIDTRTTLDMKLGKFSKPRCLIGTCKADSKKREKLMTVFATYCPICGTKYEK